MSAEIITCPACNATLRPKVALAAGSRIKCPKCMNVFVVPDTEEEAPAPRSKPAGVRPKPAPKQEEPDDLEETSEEDEVIDDEPEDDRPARKKKKKKPRKKKGT